MQVIICDDCKKVFNPEKLTEMYGWTNPEEKLDPNHDDYQACFTHALSGIEVQLKLRANPYFHTNNSDNFTADRTKSVAKDYCQKCLSKKLAKAALEVWAIYKQERK